MAKHNYLPTAGTTAQLLSLMFFLALPAAGLAQYEYITNNGTITITGYTGTVAVLEIPAMIESKSVTVIGDYAFDSCYSLTGVTIPSSITNIMDFAFEYCSSLTNVTIGSGVTRIGDSVFDSCSSLTGITIPASVTNIGYGVFWSCSELAAITVDAANPFYRSLDGVLIDTVNNRLIQCPEGKAGSVTIPDGVTVIGEYAFSDCYHLTSVTISASVTNIQKGAFWKCTSLTALYFPGNAPSLGTDVFKYVTATVYYLPGRAGWSSPFGGLTAVLWGIVNPGFAGTNGFGFTVKGASNMVVVVEAATNLMGDIWKVIQTNTLTNGSFLFSDPQATNYSRRFYRLR